jgi:hypothetical protein
MCARTGGSLQFRLNMCLCVANRIVIRYTGAPREYIASIHGTELNDCFVHLLVEIVGTEICTEWTI